jgi:hypothetical protein
MKIKLRYFPLGSVELTTVDFNSMKEYESFLEIAGPIEVFSE